MKPTKQKIVEFMAISKERVAEARDAFDTARTTYATVKVFGGSGDIEAARIDFQTAAQRFADRMREHATMVVEYAAAMVEPDA